LLENTHVRTRFSKKNSLKKRILTSFLLLLIAFSCFGDGIEIPESTTEQPSIKVALPAKHNPQSQLLPIHSKIGSIVQVNASVYHSFLYTALSSEYSYEWMESFVSDSSKKVISEIYGTYLAQNLPFSGFLISNMFENADQSISINVCNGEDFFCFVIGIDESSSSSDLESVSSLYDNLRIIAIRQL